MSILAVAAATCNSSNESPDQELRVFVADSLFLPFQAAGEAFEKANPGCSVQVIPSGSVLAARKIAEAGDRADVLAVADYHVIERMLRPTFADWYACFATNEVVIAYTEASKGGSELSADNWFQILAREGVKVGAANPYQDPCGYWAELCWRLADLHYHDVPAPGIHERMTHQCGPPADRRSDTEELLQLLESSAGIDYAFVYLSQARQHRLAALRLPAPVNLGDPEQLETYGLVSIDLPSTSEHAAVSRRGEPIVYALTIPKNAANPALAARFARFLLGVSGRAVLAEGHIQAAEQPWTYDDTGIPDWMKGQVAVRRMPASQPSSHHAD